MLPRALEEVGLHALYEDIERPLVPVLAAMERHGIRVDPDRLADFSKELDLAPRAASRARSTPLAGEEFNIGSPKQLARILFEKLKLPPVKKTKTGYSTDADVLEQLALGPRAAGQDHRAPHAGQAQVHLRRRAADADQPGPGRIHTSFNQLVAATGRLSCLPAGSLVNTRRGLVGIETVRARDLIQTCRGIADGAGGGVTGVKSVVAINLSTGRSFDAVPSISFEPQGG